MDIIIESHIPFIKGLLEARGHRVTYLSPEEFTPETVREADTIIIRTRTHACEALLRDSRVSHVITATIGTDHIDMQWCADHGIAVSNAPGCNAPAVAQYVLASIAAAKGTGTLSGLTIGIVGVGHVGRIVARWAREAGMNVMLNDPPRAAAEGHEGFCTLEEIATGADVITFHTPLTPDTHHLCDTDFIATLRRNPIIVNAARGPVIHTAALTSALQSGAVSAAIIDCWENEPEPDPELLRLATIATPHIAGYSLQGKIRASAMAAIAADPAVTATLPPVPHAPSMRQITESYNPLTDTVRLKSSPESFESLRNAYDYRPEPL